MNRNIIKICLLFVFPLLFTFCDSKTPDQNNRVVIGISADVQSFNPLFTLSVDEGAITELLYLGLFDFRWNNAEGGINEYPMLAKSWEWTGDSSSVIISLRDDAFWTDGVQITAEDIIFSFDAYSDPLVQSRLYGSFKNLFTDEENHIDLKRTFEVISPFEFKVNFPPNSVPNLYELSLSIIPIHIYGEIEREELSSSEHNFKPVSSGAYLLKKWDKNQTVTLSVNKRSFLYDDEQINEIVILRFKEDMLFRITDLDARDTMIDYLDSVSENDSIKVIVVFSSPNKSGIEEYFEFYQKSN